MLCYIYFKLHWRFDNKWMLKGDIKYQDSLHHQFTSRCCVPVVIDVNLSPELSWLPHCVTPEIFCTNNKQSTLTINQLCRTLWHHHSGHCNTENNGGPKCSSETLRPNPFDIYSPTNVITNADKCNSNCDHCLNQYSKPPPLVIVFILILDLWVDNCP